MTRYPTLLLATVLGVMPPGAWSQDAQDILQTMSDRLAERRAGVTSYLVDQTMMGRRSLTLFERISVTDGGQDASTFRMVPPVEIERRRAGTGTPLTPTQLEEFANAQEMTGAALEDEMNRGMTEAGLPPGLLDGFSAGSANEPWASPNPGIMMGANAKFLRGAAEAERNASDGTAEAKEGAQGMADFAQQAKLVGTESIDGKPAFHLRASKLGRRQPIEGGGEFVLDTMSLWVDKQAYVPLKFIATGQMTKDGQTRDIQLEKLDMDYRAVAGSNMYEPHRSIMRMGGMMSEKEEKELAKSRAELENMKKQLDAMPASQRAMVERMMGPQLAMIEGMGANGGMEIVTEVHAIHVDAGLPGQDEIGEKAMGAN